MSDRRVWYAVDDWLSEWNCKIQTLLGLPVLQRKASEWQRPALDQLHVRYLEEVAWNHNVKVKYELKSFPVVTVINRIFTSTVAVGDPSYSLKYGYRNIILSSGAWKKKHGKLGWWSVDKLPGWRCNSAVVWDCQGPISAWQPYTAT